MAFGAKPPQLHALAIDDLLGVTVAPLDGHLARRVRVHEHVERAVPLQLREKGHGGGDLAEDGRDLGLDFGFGLFLFLGCRGRVFLVGGCGSGSFGLGFGFGFGEDLNLLGG